MICAYCLPILRKVYYTMIILRKVDIKGGEKLDLYDLRKERGLTLKEVAYETGIHLASLSSYENGTREPSVKTIRALSSFYELDVGKAFECVERSLAIKKAATIPAKNTATATPV